MRFVVTSLVLMCLAETALTLPSLDLRQTADFNEVADKDAAEPYGAQDTKYVRKEPLVKNRNEEEEEEFQDPSTIPVLIEEGTTTGGPSTAEDTTTGGPSTSEDTTTGTSSGAEDTTTGGSSGAEDTTTGGSSNIQEPTTENSSSIEDSSGDGGNGVPFSLDLNMNIILGGCGCGCSNVTACGHVFSNDTRLEVPDSLEE